MDLVLLLLLLVFAPIGVGVLLFLLPGKIRFLREIVSFIVTAAAFAVTFPLFFQKNLSYILTLVSLESFDFSLRFTLNPFNSFLLIFLTGFGLLVAIYSFSYMAGKERRKEYYSFLLVTVGAGCGILVSDHFLFFLIFWEVVSISLYFLVSTGTDVSREGATKTMVMIGASDACLFAGIGVIWYITKTFTMSDITVLLNTPLSYLAFFLVLTGALTKAGSMPLHTWIPSASKGSPASVMALLPASIDKLLGIYLLLLITQKLFEITFIVPLQIMLMSIGAVTIIVAVMLALVQHELPKLLSYHAISQVGYMVLGIGTMTPIGIAGGIFHMLNNSLYKSSLFLCGGAVEKKTGTNDLGELGGLAKVMPVTFACSIIAALSISGVPPLNGFASKWMLYQGVIASPAGRFSYIFLMIAMFGSGLTLASFIKVIYSIFLGRKSKVTETVKKEINAGMLIPSVVLSIFCIVFGVVYFLPVNQFITPSLETLGVGSLSQTGFWDAPVATGFLLLGILVGILIYAVGRAKKHSRTVETYYGGEILSNEEIRVPGTDFYNTIRNMKGLKSLYNVQEKGWFDPYELFGKVGDGITFVLKKLHNGKLPFYLSWTVVGLVVLIVTLILTYFMG
ncbi:MAG: NADH dehydrogenase [Spirochaetales bacterium]|nr:NADH dehydrogenase [Spirochaetales bacterium]